MAAMAAAGEAAFVFSRDNFRRPELPKGLAVVNVPLEPAANEALAGEHVPTLDTPRLSLSWLCCSAADQMCYEDVLNEVTCNDIRSAHKLVYLMAGCRCTRTVVTVMVTMDKLVLALH